MTVILSLFWHPMLSVPFKKNVVVESGEIVTELPFGEGNILDGVHKYWFAPLANKVILWPLQITSAEDTIEISGLTPTLSWKLVVDLQLFISVPVTF